MKFSNFLDRLPQRLEVSDVGVVRASAVSLTRHEI
jgi:hypothetical protein